VPTFRRAAAPPSWIAVLRRGMVGSGGVDGLG
jgi:hypothetical protein